MFNLTYFYSLMSVRSDSCYSGVVEIDSSAEWIDSNAYQEIKGKITKDAEKASGGKIKYNEWRVVAFNKI